MPTSTSAGWQWILDVDVGINAPSEASTPRPHAFHDRSIVVPNVTAMPTVLIATLLVLAADICCWGASLGIGASLWLLLAGGAVIWRRPSVVRRRGGLIAAAALLMTIVNGAWDQGALPLALGLAALIALAVQARDAAAADPLALLEHGASALAALLTRPLRDAHTIARWRGAAPRWWHGWAWPLGFGALFVVLFALANPVIAQRLADGWSWLTEHLVLPTPLRVGFWWLAALLAWLALRPRTRSWLGALPALRIVDRTVLVRRSLIVFHLLFLIQNGLDLAYLWGHAALPPGMTWAGYAHRGAYPLVATALLAAVFILAWFRPGSPVLADRWCRRLVLLWLAQNLVLLTSAAWRLDLYVDVYGLSRWRIAAAVWMWLVAAGLALIAWRIACDLSNRALVNANALLLTATLLVLGWCDVDGAIARHNLARHQPGSDLDDALGPDLDYLESLGPAVLPALAEAKARGDFRGQLPIIRLKQRLDDDLARWQGWTVRRSRWQARMRDVW